jgi:3-methyl-2-oxobutanoate hydroxymethyltransferase
LILIHKLGIVQAPKGPELPGLQAEAVRKRRRCIKKERDIMSKPTTIRRLTVPKIRCQKGKTPIVCLTAYTAPMAKLVDSYADLILVGDSAANVIHGFDNTLSITLDHMIMHGQAVMRGSEHAMIVVDMPFGTYEESPEVAYRNAVRVMQETGCTAVKLEGGTLMEETIGFLTQRGVPVMAHIGLTPQAVQTMGGYRTQGRVKSEWARLEKDAKAVEAAGAFAVVFEGMVEPLAQKLTEELKIPTIGIGASATCDGQILVVDDMLGMSEKTPSFVKQYASMSVAISQALEDYSEDVRSRAFPGNEHTYAMKKEK